MSMAMYKERSGRLESAQGVLRTMVNCLEIASYAAITDPASARLHQIGPDAAVLSSLAAPSVPLAAKAAISLSPPRISKAGEASGAAAA